ncbi:MAG TPA: type II CAAX endopeptidase family protein [Acidobacteriota bacterium]|nr:type II CAAX endopeptidase family protein [Acidobacteriota bacterium]
MSVVQKISGIFISNRRELRSGWRILSYIVLAVVLEISLHWLYSPAARRFSTTTSSDLILEYLLLGTSVFLAAFFMLRFVDRRPFSALGFPLHGRIWREIRQGISQGVVMASIIFLVEWGGGRVTVSWSRWDIPALLTSSGYYLLLFTSAAVFEEAVARGYIFQSLIQGTGKLAAVCITSLFFGLGHVANPHAGVLGITNTVLAGVWLSVAYLRTRSLWLPTALHMSWNLILGFVCGYPVSGVPVPETIVRLSDHGPVWLTGGQYGPEAGAVATLVLVPATLYLYRSDRFRSSENAVALWSTNVQEVRRAESLGS